MIERNYRKPELQFLAEFLAGCDGTFKIDDSNSSCCRCLKPIRGDTGRSSILEIMGPSTRIGDQWQLMLGRSVNQNRHYGWSANTLSVIRNQDYLGQLRQLPNVLDDSRFDRSTQACTTFVINS